MCFRSTVAIKHWNFQANPEQVELVRLILGRLGIALNFQIS